MFNIVKKIISIIVIIFSQISNSFAEDVSIIIQGPICRKEDFTLNSVKLYNHLFPSAKVILSTWKNEDESYIDLFRKLDCHILTNKYPDTSGWKNIN